MSEPVVLYYSPMSRARIVHWMLEEVGAPYRMELVNLEKGEQKKPEFLAVNPMGKLPALQHRGVVVTESAAICAYLADAFPEAGLAPPVNSPERGTYYRWMFFGAGCIDAALVDRMLERPAASRPGAISYGSYADTLNAIEKALQPGPFILGSRFSAADVYIGSQLRFGTMTKALDSRPVFEAYLARLAARPASQRAEAQAADYLARMKATA